MGGGLAVLVALAVALAMVLTGSAHHAAAEGTTNPTPGPPQTTPAPNPALGPSASTPSTEEVQQVLDEYESDYSNKDASGLEGLFAENFVRQNGTEPREDREQAIATYQHQFEGQTDPIYQLSETEITPAPGQADVAAQYSVTNDSGKDTGSIGFHMVVQNEHLLIGAIATWPSQ